MAVSDTKLSVAVVGGNGFVGQRVLKLLVDNGHRPSCYSRTGSPPVHLVKQKTGWLDNVDWQQKDGCNLSAEDLGGQDALICLVGAAPVPTLTDATRSLQQKLNGLANTTAITAAEQAGIKRLALLGADIPAIMRCEKFGYFLGKRDSLRAAQHFSSDQNRSACVVQPPLIVGKRYLKSGSAIPLDKLLGPLQPISFGKLCSVDTVANALVNFIQEDSVAANVKIIGPRDLWQLR